MSKSTSKIVKKPSQNGVPGDPGDARGPPESLPGGSQEPVGTVFETPPRLTKDLKRSGRVPEALLGPGRHPKIDQKSTCGEKGGLGESAEKRFFIDFQCHCCFGSVFASIFDGFLTFFCMFF